MQDIVEVYPSILSGNLKDKLESLLRRDLFNDSVCEWITRSLHLLNEGHGRLIYYFRSNVHELSDLYFKVACVCLVPPELDSYLVQARKFDRIKMCGALESSLELHGKSPLQ